ncbi:MAG: hypothetical protein IBJ14_16265 [Hydrogenophaga sp.]|nr:hypothetical protein [Hydrogenophaga sp.]
MSASPLPTQRPPRPGLQAVLLLDALTCLAMGVALLAWAAPVATFTGLPPRLPVVAGVLLLPCALLMFVAGRRSPLLTGLVWLIVFGNLAWVAASAGVLFMVPSLNLIGQVLVVGQAVFVLAMAFLEWRGLAQATASLLPRAT